MYLNDQIQSVKGIGTKTALLFSKASVFCVKDIITYYPRKYIKLPDVCKIKDITVGCINAVVGIVKSAPVLFTNKGKKIVSFYIYDETGSIMVYYFGMPYLKNSFKPGMKVLLYGLISSNTSKLMIINPKTVSQDEYENLKQTLNPVYHQISGITNNKITACLNEVLNKCDKIPDYLPTDIRSKYDYPEINEAIKMIHFPLCENDVYKARKRLALDEFLFFLYNVKRLQTQNSKCFTDIVIQNILPDKFIKGLPFKLTKGQLAAINDIIKDMSSGYAMNRLVQGDVGCGKTIVALAGCQSIIENGYQAAMMAPTVVLAQQHFTEAVALNNKLGLNFKPILLTGSLTVSQKREALQGIKSGKYNLIIGTHALFTDNVEFANLGLAVCDEQHRFGVKQRMNLMEKGVGVHLLVMSATPIPRTLALILYGDLDISVIEDKPSDRLPIKNAVVGPEYRKKNYEFILKQIQMGHQAYIICPLVEEGETEVLQNVDEYTDSLREIFPSNIRIDKLHGRMKSSEKNEIMDRFKNHETDILVSTTVIEVGVNVPNATVIMIENAERFGLAQLHQLRGRVGRGQAQSYAIFINNKSSDKNTKRLDILSQSNDGFKIAAEDLKHRGPGDFFGLRQSGDPFFKMADIYTDAAILQDAKQIISESADILDNLFAKPDDIAFFYFVDNRFLCL